MPPKTTYMIGSKYSVTSYTLGHRRTDVNYVSDRRKLRRCIYELESFGHRSTDVNYVGVFLNWNPLGTDVIYSVSGLQLETCYDRRNFVIYSVRKSGFIR